MKSKVASKSTWRARSARKIAAPLSTPTRMTDCPAKSVVICAPNSLTRRATSSRPISTLSSGMGFHIKLGSRILKKQESTTSQEPGTMNLKGVKLTWLGHATFRIETPGGKTVIIDPWVMNNPMCPESERKVKKVDILLCTHGHGDHIGDAVEICKQHNPIVVGIPELAGWLRKKGARQIAEMNKGGTQNVGDIKVTMVHADHSCGIQDGDELIYGGEACGYVMEFSNGVKIYHAGDTNVFGDMAI